MDRVFSEAEESACVILTGGHAKLLENVLLIDAKISPDLVLDGLAFLLPMEKQSA